MRLAVVLVHYHTPELVPAALESLRAGLGEGGVSSVDWLLVDNGSDAAGRALLESLPVRRLDPGANLGYAGGANLGVAAAPQADAFLLMNPDVLVLPGCLPALLGALGPAAAAVAGPAFFWDRGRRLLLPPGEPRGRREELVSALAGRGGSWAARARRRWRCHARRHWEARRPLASHCLSGSLLAFTRAAWERVGPFDEGYRLYFEETDWLLRAAARGVPAWYVPGAEAVHLYDRSGAREPRSRAWFEESAARFRRRHYGPRFARGVEALAARARRKAVDQEPEEQPGEGSPEPFPAGGLTPAFFSSFSPEDFPLWIELSPNPGGWPAAAERLAAPPAPATAPWSPPAEIAARFPAPRGWVTVSDAAGRERGRYVWQPEPVPAAAAAGA